MSNLSITANLYLRNNYSTDRNLVNKSERKLFSNATLSKADSKALGKSISTIENYDFDSEDPDSTDFYNTLKAFADTYNYTMESGKESTDETTKSMIKKFKQLKDEHSEELEKFGITFNEKGVMEISKSATENIKVSRFKEILGEDTEFMSQLSSLQKRLTKHINYLA